jgi:hypothetical protein
MKKRSSQSSQRRGVTGGMVLGQGWFETISAVEGIKLSARAKTRAAEFDSRGLSNDERRRAIVLAYRKG